MTPETEVTQANPCRDADPKVRADALYKAALGAQIGLWQIKAIAQMLNDLQEVQKIDFPEEIAGGISAILTLTTHTYDEMGAKL